MPPVPFAALRHRNFRLFIFGQFISLIGTWMQGVALGWLVLTLTNSAFAVGLVSAMGALPVLLFTLQGGALADQVNRHRALTFLQIAMLLEAVALATLTLTGHASLPWILVLALISGSLSAYEIPIRQAFLMDLVGRDDLMNAIAFNSMAFNLSRVMGPALAGIITALAGPGVCFLVNAASYLSVIASLLRIRPDPALLVPHRQPPPLQAAMAYLLAPGWPRTLVTLAAIYTIFGVSFLAVLPVYARDVLHTGAGGYGWLTSAFGVGAASGALLLAAYGSRFRRGEFAIRSGIAIGIVLLTIAFVPLYPVTFVGLIVGGMAAATSAIVTNTLLQTEAPDHLRGRVIGFYSFIVVGLAPLGSLQAGWLGQRVGVRSGAAMGGFLCLGCAFILMRRIKVFARSAAVERRQVTDDQPYRWGERRQA